MASWHERDCRRPDVLLMDDVPTCLSCGSLFLQMEMTQEELSKHTAAVNKSSPRLNLDWPSSITFYSPDDVTDPDLRKALLALDRYIENAGSDTAVIEENSKTGTKVEHSATSGGDSQDITTVSPTEDTLTDDHGAQKTTKRSQRSPSSEHNGRDPISRNIVYQSLLANDEIRLLHLDPQENASQPLHGYLRPARLSMRPDYTALSYTWADLNGDRTLCDKIFLGKAWTPFAITSNCAAALRRLRLRGGTCVVWVDAICIDQTNIGERSHQVSMMRDIYSRAESVSIFLGGDTHEDYNAPARRLLRRLSEDRFHAGKEVTSEWGRKIGDSEIRDLFEQPYWSRIWVIQEVLLARHAEIILGHASVSLHEFITNFMSRIPGKMRSFVPPWLSLPGGSLFGDLDSFFDLLHKTSMCKASDDRDMVFALFGLVQGASLEGLVADYSKTKSEIYIGLTAYFLIRHGHVGLLKAAASGPSFAAGNKPVEITDGVKRDIDLPSWVPFAAFRTSIRIPNDTRRVHHHLPSEMYKEVQVRPTSYYPAEASLPPLHAHQVFGNHGTLLIRALPVVHMSCMGSAVLHDAFILKNSENSTLCGLIATGTAARWGISVQSDIVFGANDDWVIEVPGCDRFIHLQSSGRVPDTYRIASLSSVTLHNFQPEPLDPILGFIGNFNLNAAHWSFFENQLSPAADSAAGYKLWMPLVSCGLQLLPFLRHWEANTLKDRLLAPHQPIHEDSPSELTTQVLETYDRWLELKCPPNFVAPDCESAVRTVSLYLERWEDRHLWSRIYKIVVEVPWREKLQELADIKVDAWHYLATRERYNDGDDEHWSTFHWQNRLQELFEDLTCRLSDIPPENSGVEPSLGRFMSANTCLSLCNSITNVPDCWTINDIQTNETEIMEDWIGVETCWDFMERSKADCRALRAKFAQLRALRRLCRREQRDFLIC